ncbi:MAG: DUF4339 domain-containing protein [Pirellula sp.]
MGIHFACHHCNHSLHVKDFQAGKRGRCPECKGAFRIPNADASHSLGLDSDLSTDSVALDLIGNASNQATLSVASKTSSNKSSSSIPRENANGANPSDPASNSMAPPTTQPPLALPPPAQTPRGNAPPTVGFAGMPPILANAINAAWFVRPPSGGQFGPASPQLLMDWILEKRVTQDSFLWREGMPQWQLALELVPELFDPPKLGEAPPKLGEAPTVPAPVSDTISISQSANSVSELAKKRREKKRRQQLTVVIVLSILSFVLLVILIFVLLFPPLKPTATTSHIVHSNKGFG